MYLFREIEIDRYTYIDYTKEDIYSIFKLLSFLWLLQFQVNGQKNNLPEVILRIRN